MILVPKCNGGQSCDTLWWSYLDALRATKFLTPTLFSPEALLVHSKSSSAMALLSQEAAKSSTDPSQGVDQVTKHFPFLKLPAELRNRIYELVVHANYFVSVACIRHYSKDEIHSHSEFDEPNSLHRYRNGKIRVSFFPSILHVCRQMRRETSSMYYDSNVFSITSCFCEGRNAHKLWINNIPYEQQQHLREVWMVVDGRAIGIWRTREKPTLEVRMYVCGREVYRSTSSGIDQDDNDRELDGGNIANLVEFFSEPKNLPAM